MAYRVPDVSLKLADKEKFQLNVDTSRIFFKKNFVEEDANWMFASLITQLRWLMKEIRSFSFQDASARTLSP